jgi:hypothetical protein
MDQEYSSALLYRLSNGTPDALQRWLDEVSTGRIAPPVEFNWLGLADAAAANARKELDPRWGLLALAIYDRLAKEKNTDARERNALLLAGMNLRAYMMSKLGVDPRSPILDLDEMIRLFNNNVNLSIDEASLMTRDWTTLPAERMLELRDIKNMLAPFKVLADRGLLIDQLSLLQWLALREALP